MHASNSNWHRDDPYWDQILGQVLTGKIQLGLLGPVTQSVIRAEAARRDLDLTRCTETVLVPVVLDF